MIRTFRNRIKITIVVQVFFWLAISGCSGIKNRMLVENTRPLRQSIKTTVDQTLDIELIKAGMPASLIQLDGFIALAPDNPELLVNAAEAYSGYAFAFVEDEDSERAARLYKKAMGYAMRALELNEPFKSARNQNLEKFTEALQTFEKTDVPAMFHAANCWLKWISFNLDNPRALMDLPKVEAMMARVRVLDEAYLYGSIHAMLGAYTASRSVALGGKPETARHHFMRAFELSGSRYLIFQWLYARFYAVQIQDRELFVKTLENIIAAPDNLLPEKNLANAIAKQKATRLIQEADVLF